MRYVALLRGINVSGQKKILMADLRKLLSVNSQLNNIQTYIQSGNIIFESESTNTADLAELIYTYIYKEYNFKVPIQIYSIHEWKEIIENNPYINKNNIEINRLYATLFKEILSEQNIDALKKVDFTPDSFIIHKNIIYLDYPNGVGRSKMTNAVFERKLNISATSRNWKTVSKIMKLLNE